MLTEFVRPALSPRVIVIPLMFALCVWIASSLAQGLSHRVFAQILAQQVTGLGRGLQSQVIIMNWLSSKCYLLKQYCVPL